MCADMHLTPLVFKLLVEQLSVNMTKIEKVKSLLLQVPMLQVLAFSLKNY